MGILRRLWYVDPGDQTNEYSSREEMKRADAYHWRTALREPDDVKAHIAEMAKDPSNTGSGFSVVDGGQGEYYKRLCRRYGYDPKTGQKKEGLFSSPSSPSSPGTYGHTTNSSRLRRIEMRPWTFWERILSLLQLWPLWIIILLLIWGVWQAYYR
jgi:hypothetical protein